MMNCTENSAGRRYGLQSLELKALSVPSSLRFLIGVEYDVLQCVTEVGSRRSFTIRFPFFANTFRIFLELCAERFCLSASHFDDHSVLSGIAMVPLLRYIDYLPGALHMEELLNCLGVTQRQSLVRNGDSAHDFLASFIDYSDYKTDASLVDVYGTGFYLTLDYGLSIATHGHLVEIGFHKGCTVDDALREFIEFSGWSKFDIRFFDDHDKHLGGVIVFPSIQDACDVFEKYEDEDSDDEGDLLPFMLRPVSPLVSVPCVEDSALKKLREQHWDGIEKFWDRFPKWQNCVVVSNLYDAASLEEALAFFDGLPITASSIVEDNSPAHRRRVFVTFATADAARKALLQDGKSTKGKTLRVQVSPPYMNESRRGRVVGTDSASSSEQPARDAAALSPSPHGKRAHFELPPAAFPAPARPDRSTGGGDRGDESGAALPPPCSPPLAASTMNVNAREFVPSVFQMNANSPKFYPTSMPMSFEESLPPPPAYLQMSTPPVVPAVSPLPTPVNIMRQSQRTPQMVSAPPPYTAPPPYAVATVLGVHMMPQSATTSSQPL